MTSAAAPHVRTFRSGHTGTVPRASRPDDVVEHPVLALQRLAGNRAVVRHLASIGRPDGALEPIEGEPVKHDGAEPSHHSLRVRVNLSFTGRSLDAASPVTGERAKADAVAAVLGFGSSVRRAGPAQVHGEEFATYVVDGISWSKTGSTVNINARMFVRCTWNINGGKKINVPSADAPAVTKATHRAIAADLKPNAAGIPKRKKYWCSDITGRHERFHAKDDIGRARLYLPTAKAWLQSQTVVPTDVAVKALLERARQRVEADGWAWYYGTPGGEARAYADGKPFYTDRSNMVRARKFAT